MTPGDVAAELPISERRLDERLRAKTSAGAAKSPIIHLSKHCRYGNGNVHVAVDLACVQAKAGREVIFASEGGTFVEMLERHGVRHVTLLQDQRRPLALLRSFIQLVQLCRRVRPPVIHAHMMLGAALGWAASRLTGAKLVTTVHNSFDRHSVLMRLGDAVVAVSEAERRQLVRRGFDERRLISIWNAPDKSPREKFMRNERDVTLSKPCVVAICGLHRRKGVGDLIDAFASVAPGLPEWQLYIAGDGPDRETLQDQARTLGMAERIVFLGFMPAPRSLFETADIFVLPSHADPGSLSIGEARAAGCAIIATAVGGTSEMLEFGRAGRLVAPALPQQLAVELARLMSNAGERAALRDAALAGSEIFDVARLVQDYDRAYDLAMQRSAPRAASAHS